MCKTLKSRSDSFASLRRKTPTPLGSELIRIKKASKGTFLSKVAMFKKTKLPVEAAEIGRQKIRKGLGEVIDRCRINRLKSIVKLQREEIEIVKTGEIIDKRVVSKRRKMTNTMKLDRANMTEETNTTEEINTKGAAINIEATEAIEVAEVATTIIITITTTATATTVVTTVILTQMAATIIIVAMAATIGDFITNNKRKQSPTTILTTNQEKTKTSTDLKQKMKEDTTITITIIKISLKSLSKIHKTRLHKLNQFIPANLRQKRPLLGRLA